MKPNIFDIATKELNQDAFITWLLQYADNKYRQYSPTLNDCGKLLVTELLKKHLPGFNEEIVKVEAGRQWENIDIWAEINDKYLIIIEDKTYSSHHSNQLSRYKQTAEDWCKKENYNVPVLIYLKTGNESQANLNTVMAEGYTIYARTDLITLLDKFKNCTNDIFIDFHSRLQRIEESNNQFKNKSIKEWRGDDWQGFFQFLEKRININNWFFVNNPGGGFWAAVLNWHFWGIYPAYLQIEENKLCFKISTHPGDLDLSEDTNKTEVRDNLSKFIVAKSKEYGLNDIRRPSRFGNGNYMTVAVVDVENWLGNPDPSIVIENVIENLIKYTEFLLSIVEPVSV